MNDFVNNPPLYLVIGKEGCSYCVNTKLLLDEICNYTYVDQYQVNLDDVQKLQEIAGQEFITLPQIFKYKEGGGLKYIGGFTELDNYLKEL